MQKIFKMILANLFVVSLFGNCNDLKAENCLYYENEPISQARIYNDYKIQNPGYTTEQNKSRSITPINPMLPASTQRYSGNKNFTKFYFSNLLNNFPTNYDGICGYTAITMLMTYYDVYWNNNFVNSIYSLEQNSTNIQNLNDMVNTYVSPGVRDQYISISNFVQENFSNAQKETGILNRIQENKDAGTFLGFLLDLSVTSGVQKTNYYNTGDYLTQIGVDYNIMTGLLTQYINTLPFYNISIVSNSASDTVS
jgi:hypothetical protein